VVDTRTELDWGMKHGQTCVWAPSKLVLDAVHGPERGASAQHRAHWLAGELGASELLCVGAEAPASAVPVPVRSLPVGRWE
jgi:7,8-dihydroneopterin aldolase/epimerase/oxygenase